MNWPLNDEQREQVIETCMQLAHGSSDSALRRYWADLMRDEIARRSPEQVVRLEIAKGLRAA